MKIDRNTKEKLIKQFNECHELDVVALNQHELWIIVRQCLNCQNHDEIDYNGEKVHCCFDNWSGIEGNGIGWHPIYDETLDLCAECGGRKLLEAASCEPYK